MYRPFHVDPMAMTQNIFPPWGSFMSESRRFLRDEGFFPRRLLHGSDEGCGVGFRTLRPLPRRLLRRDVFFGDFIPPMFPFLPLSLSLFPFINSQKLSLFFVLCFFFPTSSIACFSFASSPFTRLPRCLRCFNHGVK